MLIEEGVDIEANLDSVGINTIVQDVVKKIEDIDPEDHMLYILTSGLDGFKR